MKVIFARKREIALSKKTATVNAICCGQWRLTSRAVSSQHIHCKEYCNVAPNRHHAIQATICGIGGCVNDVVSVTNSGDPNQITCVSRVQWSMVLRLYVWRISSYVGHRIWICPLCWSGAVIYFVACSTSSRLSKQDLLRNVLHKRVIAVKSRYDFSSGAGSLNRIQLCTIAVPRFEFERIDLATTSPLANLPVASES